MTIKKHINSFTELLNKLPPIIKAERRISFTGKSYTDYVLITDYLFVPLMFIVILILLLCLLVYFYTIIPIFISVPLTIIFIASSIKRFKDRRKIRTKN